jgi:hypothetical protein
MPSWVSAAAYPHREDFKPAYREPIQKYTTLGQLVARAYDRPETTGLGEPTGLKSAPVRE